MSTFIKKPSTVLTALVFLGLFVLLFKAQVPVSASAPSGLTATVATTSVFSIGAGSAATLFATSTNCAARVIQTGASEIMLTFSDYAGQSPTGTFGLVQSASTTVAYDSGLYGCGLIKGFSFSAQPLTLMETR